MSQHTTLNFFDEQDLDEIPISNLLFVSGDGEGNFNDNVNFGDITVSQEECADPLMIEPSILPLSQDPLETFTPTLMVVEEPRSHGSATRLKRAKNVVLSSTANLSFSSTSTTIPVIKSVTSGFQPPTQNATGRPSGSQFKSMTFDEFTQEMERNIHDIVSESIGLFGRDPREYHPVYLRIYKYLTIGQRLGYVATDEAYVNSVWTGFFKYADTEFSASKKQTKQFTGERSAYATYLLTRKLMINGKMVIEKRNESERQKMFKELEATAKRIRNEWNNRASPGVEIRDDLNTRLKFFKECMIVTHPTDCLKMNNLWTKFLSEKGFVKRKKECVSKSTLPRVASNINSEISLVTIPSDAMADDNIEEESRKSLRKIIKVIVTPSFSSLNEHSEHPTTISISLSPSPPCSPAAPSPIPLSSPVPSSPQPSSSTLMESKPTITSNSKTKNVKTNQRSLQEVHKNVKSMPVQEKLPKGKIIKKVCSTTLLKKTGTAGKLKHPLMTSILKKKRKLLSGVLSSKANNSDVSRQLKLEKIIIQGKSKLLSGVVRRKQKQVGKTDKIKKEMEQDEHNLSTNILSSSQPSPSNLNPLIKKKKIFKLKETGKAKEKTGSSSVKKQVSIKMPSLLEKKKKQRALLVLKKRKNSDILQKRLEKIICQSTERKMELEREKMLERKRETFSLYSKYGKLKINCPIKTCGTEISLCKLSDHLKRKHKIVEDGKFWSCPVCRKQSISRRDSWLGHIEKAHGSQVNMEELIEKAKNVHPDAMVPGRTAKEKKLEVDETVESLSLSQSQTIAEEQNDSSNIQASSDTVIEVIAKPSESSRKKENRQVARVVCDECGNDYMPYYMPIHKAVKHNYNRQKIKCPVCEKEFSDVKYIWSHFCEFHLKGENPLKILDPVSKGLSIPEDAPEPVRKKREYTPVSTVCQHCGKSFANPSTLARHMYQVHGEGTPKHENLQCQYCQRKFKVKETLVAHVNRIHEGKVKSKCQHCGNDLQTPGKLWRHLIDNHGETPFEAAAYCEVTFVPCAYCGLELLEGKQLNGHIKTQHPESFDEFMFGQVSEKLLNQKDLEKLKEQGLSLPRVTHYSEMTREMRKLKKREERRRWREEGVGPAWIQRENPLHQRDKPGDCAECGKTFQKLKRHMRTVHNVDTRGLRCPFEECIAELKTVRSLKVHVRTCHSSVIDKVIVDCKIVKVVDKIPACTVYLCTLCREYLYHFEEVKVHMVASHPQIFADVIGKDNVPPPLVPPPPAAEFLCPHCPSKFPKDEDVRGHVEQAHLELCWRCPECSMVMLNPDDFEKHFSAEHSGETRKDNEKEKDVEEIGTFVKLIKRYYNRKKTYHAPFGRRTVPKRSEEQQEREQLREKMCAKFNQMKIQCEICGTEMSMRLLANHIKVDHEVEEDIEPLLCKLCPRLVPFNIYKDKGRSYYLCHMEKYHSNEVDMEEMVKTMSKVYIKTDWRTLNIKNPEGGTGGRKRKLVKTFDNDDDKRGIKRRKKRIICKAKLSATRVQCEICEKEISLKALEAHIKRIHGLNEEPLSCKICPAIFNIQESGGRISYLYHVELLHGGEVDMAEMLQLVTKVNTKDDWRTVETKNAKRIRARKGKETMKKAKQKRKSRTKDESDDDEEEISESESTSDKSDWEESKQEKSKPTVKKRPDKKVKNKTRERRDEPASLTVRTSGRNRKIPGKYAAFFNDENQSDMENEIEVKRGTTESKRSVTNRFAKRVEGSRGFTKEKKNELKMSLIENIEKEKTLFIKLTRLTEEELSRYLHCSQKIQDNFQNTPKIKLEGEREREDEQPVVDEQCSVTTVTE